MANELAIRNSSAVTQGISPEQVEVLRKTLFKKFSDDEIQFALAVCARTGLDPFSKQVHFRKQGDRDDIVIITGIDGFRLTANRSQAYAGSDEPIFELDKNGKPVKASVTVYKMVQGQRCPFTATARWSEFYPGDKQGFMWRKMPFVMLGKCAEAQALRKAFPAELSNIYSHEEMAQAASDATQISTKAQEVNRLLDAPEGAPDLEVEAQQFLDEPDFVTEAASNEAPDLGGYVIPIGKKYKGKKLSEVAKPTLAEFVAWVEENVDHKTDQTLEFLSTAAAYLEQAK